MRLSDKCIDQFEIYRVNSKAKTISLRFRLKIKIVQENMEILKNSL